MYILGSMVRLEANELRIPIPWWHRAPLGLETGTQVFVSITQSQGNRPGDLIVSVLNPNRWDQHVTIRCPSQDHPGVIEQALDKVGTWNVALAEALTVETGTRHDVDLICESVASSAVPDRRLAALRRDLRPHFPNASVQRFPSLESPIEWTSFGQVEHGWVEISGRSWRSEIDKQLRILGVADRFDTGKLVLSADTTTRTFRGVIPRRGAVRVEIEHADEPLVLHRLTTALREANINVLSMLLKRGGAAARNAIMVAICEPVENMADPDLTTKIEAALGKLPQELRSRIVIDEGDLASDRVVYSRHPDDVVARVPSYLKARVLERKKDVPVGRHPVFLSRRFLKDEKPQRYAAEIRRVLEDNGCIAVEAEPQSDMGGGTTSFDEVYAAMWAARAGIVLGAEPAGEIDVLSLNLAHEFGFLHGQGKPVLPLIEAASRVENALDKWTNIKGIVAPRFDPEFAFDPTHLQSIRQVVGKWLSSIRW